MAIMIQKLRKSLASTLASLSIKLMAWAIELAPNSTCMNGKPNKYTP